MILQINYIAVLCCFVLLVIFAWLMKSVIKYNLKKDGLKHQNEIDLKLKYLKTDVQKRLIRDFSSDEISLITYQDLKYNVNIGELVEVNAGVFYKAVDLSGPVLWYKTYISAGWYFGGQVHDCFERCFVVRGSLKPGPKSNICVGPGKFLDFDINVAHNPGSEIQTEIDVYFSLTPFD
mgnify:CR=1 FL=1|tara:strand:+ start:3868 stop:4401 length:534 start_codon:yes stop_codon:yes gene_type:complete